MRERVKSRVSLYGETNIKLKPDTFDGSAPLRKFFAQFDLIARANCWELETKITVLVSYLRKADVGKRTKFREFRFFRIEIKIRVTL